MPKEVFHDENPHSGGGFVQVGRGKDHGIVQIATREGGDYRDDFDRPGQFVSLSRSEINRLIATLRRARDAAYGKDA